MPGAVVCVRGPDRFKMELTRITGQQNWLLVVGIFVLTHLGQLATGQSEPELDPTTLSNRVLENRATGKCLTLSKDYTLILDTCNYILDEASLAGVFSVGPTFRTGQLLRWKTGPKFEAPEGCLQSLQAFKPKKQQEDEEDEDGDDDDNSAADDDDDDVKGAKRGEVRLVVCNNTDDTLNWVFERKNIVKGAEAEEEEIAGQYWVKKSPDGPCLAGWTKTEGLATVFTLPCKADDDRQLWRICEEVGPVKCDP